MPPSVTYWNRLEPRPRASSIVRSLAAEIRDPAWMLGRQHQLGRFRGEDAGSPAYTELIMRRTGLLGWRADQLAPLARVSEQAAPLDCTVEAEPFRAGLDLRVELGQTLEMLLRQRGAKRLIGAFRATYPLPLLLDEQADRLFALSAKILDALDAAAAMPTVLAQTFRAHGVVFAPNTVLWVMERGRAWVVTDGGTGQSFALRRGPDDISPEDGPRVPSFFVHRVRDRDALRFLRVCAGRAIDGVAAYQRLRDAPDTAVPGSITDAAGRDAARVALDEFAAWIREVFGEIGDGDAASWRPDRLEYGLEVVAAVPPRATDAAAVTGLLAAYPGRDADLDWHAFDVRQEHATIPDVAPGEIPTTRATVLPVHVRFRGMPNRRWWSFERHTTSFGDVQPDKRDLAKLIVMDFMLVQGNDWFIVPLEQPLGSLCRIDALLVHDVFGGRTLVKRAERADAASAAPAPGGRWTMFTLSREDEPGEIADFFLMPPGSGAAAQTGPSLEEVRLLRDEMANMVWAVEQRVENAVGQPWPGHERALAVQQAVAAAPGVPAAEGEPTIRYRIQTSVPANWIPFLPVLEDSARGSFRLEMNAVLDEAGRPMLPAGRILQPTHLDGNGAYRLFEEEVPREGTSVRRVVRRSRWDGGDTHLWIARQTSSGAGEGSSGLRFDQIEAVSGATALRASGPAGFYPSGSSDWREPGTAELAGTEILILKTNPGPLRIHIDSTTGGLSGGDIHPTYAAIFGPSDPKGDPSWHEPNIGFGFQSNAVTTVTIIEGPDGVPFRRIEVVLDPAENGIFRVLFASYAFPLFQRLTEDLPEALVVKPTASYVWGTSQGEFLNLSAGQLEISVANTQLDNQKGGFPEGGIVRVTGIDLRLGEKVSFLTRDHRPLDCTIDIQRSMGRMQVSGQALFGASLADLQAIAEALPR